MKFLILLFFVLACSFRLSPNEVALLFMKNRYFNPPQAYQMIKPGQISESAFMIMHEEMLRIKDYKLNSIIKFKVTKSIVKEKTAEITVETIRPDVKKIFSGFYQEKLVHKWDKKEIQNQIKTRLFDPKAPQQILSDVIKLELTNQGWRVLFTETN